MNRDSVQSDPAFLEALNKHFNLDHAITWDPTFKTLKYPTQWLQPLTMNWNMVDKFIDDYISKMSPLEKLLVL